MSGPSAQAPVPNNRPQPRPADTGNRDWQADTSTGVSSRPAPSRADDRYDSMAASTTGRGEDDTPHSSVQLNTPEQRFAAFAEFLKGSRAEVLGRGLADWTPNKELALTFLKARHVSDARRAVKQPKTAEALARFFDRNSPIRIVDRASTGNVSSDILRHAMSDPAVRRIVDRLQARPETARKIPKED